MYFCGSECVCVSQRWETEVGAHASLEFHRLFFPTRLWRSLQNTLRPQCCGLSCTPVESEPSATAKAWLVNKTATHFAWVTEWRRDAPTRLAARINVGLNYRRTEREKKKDFAAALITGQEAVRETLFKDSCRRCTDAGRWKILNLLQSSQNLDCSLTHTEKKRKGNKSTNVGRQSDGVPVVFWFWQNEQTEFVWLQISREARKLFSV